jgi:hypothetical protein
MLTYAGVADVCRWENLYRAIIHCPDHSDPLCEILWTGEDQYHNHYCQCAVVAGPKAGLFAVLYMRSTGGGIEKHVNPHASKLRFSPKVKDKVLRLASTKVRILTQLLTQKHKNTMPIATRSSRKQWKRLPYALCLMPCALFAGSGGTGWRNS